MRNDRRFIAIVAAFLTIGLSAGVALAANSATPPNKSPFVLKRPWGTFKLSPRIIKKLENQDTINVGLSMEGQTIPIYGPQYKLGFKVGLKDAATQYGIKLKGVYMGPVAFNPSEQIAQLRSAIATNSLDCWTVEGGGNPAFAPLIDQSIAKGIPVFTVGTEIKRTKRLSGFYTDWVQEGSMNARAVAAKFKAMNVPLKEAMLTTGDITAQFSQDRMNGFVTTLKQLVPGVTFLNSPKSALNTGFDPNAVYSQVKAYLQGHPNVQVIYQTDAGAEFIDKLIGDLGKKGTLFTAGHNVSLGNLRAIQDGLQISTIDQNYPAQSAFPSRACAAFLTTGQILPNDNAPRLITAANVRQSRIDFIKTGGTAPAKK